MCQNCLLKAEKKVYLETKKANNNHKADNNKNASNDKDASLLISITTPLSCFAPVATSTYSLISGSINSSLARATATFVAVYPSFFSFLTHYTTPISHSSIQVFRSTLVPLEDDYAV